jgi:alginate O-acetyltransferase complex protein AlgI
MQFNSLIFIIFVAIFFSAWPILRRKNNTRWLYLVIASFIFYGWWDWRFLFLLVGSGFIDFFAGLAMQRFPRHRKIALVLSVLGNVGSLAVFKYLDFSIQNLNWLFHSLGMELSLPLANLILPVGISFYTFQSMSYTIDIYRRQLQPTHNVFHFFAYLSLFPQLVAGPIIRARDLLPQLEHAVAITEQQRYDGLKLIVAGFFKKVVIADTLAPMVNAAFTAGTPAESCSYWWVIMIMFAYQIYCDFSGYSDIARGLGKWMGYEFPVNFDHPYIASSFREFWQRWHISLSTWFRDYVYIPLGGSRKGPYHSYAAMWATMLISGLWHGAAWHFIAWAALHSFYLSMERVTRWPEKMKKLPLGKHLTTLTVFLLAVIAWVFFRAENFGQGITILKTMFSFNQFNGELIYKLIDNKNRAISVLLIIMGRQLFYHFNLNEAKLADATPSWRPLLETLVLAVMIFTCVYMRGPGNTFIYFQF